MDYGEHLSGLQDTSHFNGPNTRAGIGQGGMAGGMAGEAHNPIAITQGQRRMGRGLSNGGAASPRSPPKQKSTSHVPCKFYPSGQCQAGNACQFSHDMDPMTQNAPCKYFARGSCKFGHGCALMHILPDGRIINRPGRGGASQFNRRSQQGSMFAPGGASSPLAILPQEAGIPQHDALALQGPDATYMQASSPTFRTNMNPSTSSSPYGSPPNDYSQAMSPSRRGVSARDAQLPSSWDSQGISQAARNGPFAASVPGRFGLESPPPSFPSKTQLGGTAFGYVNDTVNLDGVLHGLGGSSPRELEPLSFAKRPLHSERFARPRMALSSSLNFQPTTFPSDPANAESDDGSDDGASEGLLPSSLHDLLPVRRASRSGPEADDANAGWGTSRRVLSNGANTEAKSGSLSPLGASPSRYSAMWAARSSGKSDDANPVSAFGHVGSPLRPSNLRTSSTSEHGGGMGSLSMLTSQLRGAELADGGPVDAPQPVAVRPAAAPPPPAASLDRQASAWLGTSVGAGRDKIEEETMFSMEEEEGVAAAAAGAVGEGHKGGKDGVARTWASMAAAAVGRGGK